MTALQSKDAAGNVTGCSIGGPDLGAGLAINCELLAVGPSLAAGHEMAFARKVAQKLVFMDGGKIVEQDPPEDPFRNPQMHRLRTF